MADVTTTEAIDTFMSWIKRDSESELEDREENIAIYKKAVWALKLVESIQFMTAPRGSWQHSVEYLNDAPHFITSCPVCKYRVQGESNFCPDCGADLRGGL